MDRPRPRLTLVEPERAAPADPPAPPGRALEVAALGTALVLTVALLARLPSWRGELGTFQSLYAVAFAFFALALARGLGHGTPPHAASTVLVVAAAARLALLPVTPTLSDDVYRYVWEGTVVAHGGNPYRASPNAAVLAPLRDREIHPRVNHPELATVYPPLAIAGFALVARLSPTVTAMKLWVVLHDLALVLLLVRALERRGRNPLAAVAYAWNPLVLVEYAGNGHNDPTALVGLVAAVLWAERRPALSATALALGTLVKLAPLVALPFLWSRWNGRARAIALGALAAGGVFFIVQTRGTDSGLAAYWGRWENNDLVFPYLAGALGGFAPARNVAIAIVALTAIALLGRRWSAERGTRTVLRTGVLVSPVAHPWYLGWALALEPLAPTPWRPAGVGWLLLSLTAILSYGVLTPPPEGGAFHLPLAWRWAEYGVPLVAAGAMVLARRAPRRS